MTTKKKNRRASTYDAEIAFIQEIRALPPGDRPGLLDWFRRLRHDPDQSEPAVPACPTPPRRRPRRRPRAFWHLDPTTGRWRPS